MHIAVTGMYSYAIFLKKTLPFSLPTCRVQTHISFDTLAPLFRRRRWHVSPLRSPTRPSVKHNGLEVGVWGRPPRCHAIP